MQSYPVFGMYQPDAIKLIRHNEVDYIVSANEGDSKEYGDDFNEEPRVKDLMLSSNFGKLVFDIFLFSMLIMIVFISTIIPLHVCTS